jgi:hypothetical protein
VSFFNLLKQFLSIIECAGRYDEAIMAFNGLKRTFKGDEVLSARQVMRFQQWLGAAPNNASAFLLSSIDVQLLYIDDNKN